jgi:CIC family chloride channel protein
MAFGETIRRALRRLLAQVTASDTATGIALAIAVGVAAGLGAVAFRELISALQSLFFDRGADAFSGIGGHYVIIIPAIGGLFVGFIIYFFAREAKGHGVPEVMGAVATDVGRIPVVDRSDRTKLLGILRRHDIIKAYRRKLEETTERGRGY